MIEEGSQKFTFNKNCNFFTIKTLSNFSSKIYQFTNCYKFISIGLQLTLEPPLCANNLAIANFWVNTYLLELSVNMKNNEIYGYLVLSPWKKVIQSIDLQSQVLFIYSIKYLSMTGLYSVSKLYFFEKKYLGKLNQRW